MDNNNFTATFLFEQTPKKVFDAINNVYAWWSEDFKGSSQQLNDEFEVRFFGDVHYSRHQLVEWLPAKKIAWLVTDSQLNFLKDKKEWDGTRNMFEISVADGKTKLVFTHEGLTPDIECYNSCFKGWAHYLGSLQSLITTGKGQPYQKETVLK